MKKCKTKYSTGGQLLGSLASLIPGYGQIISPLIGIADQMLTKPEIPEPKAPPVKMNTNVYGNSFKLGGWVGDGFKQYSTGSHTSGRDLAIDQNGFAKNDGQALVQNQENMVKIKGKPYIMSDTLTNPRTGNTFNVDAAKANKKYKNARYSTDEKNALNREMQDLAMANDVMRASKESKMKFNGGPIDPLNRMQAESTFVRPTPFMIPQLPTTGLIPAMDLGYPTIPVTQRPGFSHAEVGSSKSKSRAHGFREKAYGGPITNLPSVLTGEEPWVSPEFTNPAELMAQPFVNSYQPTANNAIRNKSWVDSLGKVHEPDNQLTIENLPGNNDMFVPKTTSPLNAGLQPLPTYNLQSTPKPPDVSVPNYTSDRSTLGTTTSGGVGNVANAIGLGLKGLALGRSFFDSQQEAQVDPLITPDYSKADQYLKEANISYAQTKQNILGASNQLGNMNRSSTRSFGQFAGREASRNSSLIDAYSNVDMAEANAQSQLNLQKGSIENSRAMDNANRTYQNQQNNFANQANQRGFQRDFFGDLSTIGSTFNQVGETNKMIQNSKDMNQFNTNQTLSFLSAKYPNIKVSNDIVAKFQQGQLSLDEFLTYVPTNIRAEVKQQVSGK